MLLGALAWNVRSAMSVLSCIRWLAQIHGLIIRDSDTGRGVLSTIYDRVYSTCNDIGFDNTTTDRVIQDTAVCPTYFQQSGINGTVWSGLNVPTTSRD